MKKIIIAYPVQDLTVARYLAAREVDIIGIDLDRREPIQNEFLINQMRNWIEGPQIVGFTENNETFQNQFYSILDDMYFKPAFLLSDPTLADPNFEEENPYIFINNLVEFNELSELQKKVAIVILNSSYSPQEINGNHGWLVNPGHEEMTGICDFDALDLLLDELV